MKLFFFILVLLTTPAFAATNFCAGKKANTFYCTNDTQFQHCTGNGNFVMKACAQPICVTRTPADRNPCVGRTAAKQADGVEPPVVNNGDVVPAPTPNPTPAPAPGTGGNGSTCTGGPKFDPAGAKNVGNGKGIQFIGGQCLNGKDCASGCCAGPCGICSGVGAQFQAGKTGCGFGG